MIKKYNQFNESIKNTLPLKVYCDKNLPFLEENNLVLNIIENYGDYEVQIRSKNRATYKINWNIIGNDFIKFFTGLVGKYNLGNVSYSRKIKYIVGMDYLDGASVCTNIYTHEQIINNEVDNTREYHEIMFFIKK